MAQIGNPDATGAASPESGRAMRISPLDEALSLASSNIPCFPCLADKRPATPNGFYDATSNPAEVAELWHRYPGTLVGIPTGESTGLDVLDIDPRHGGHLWTEKNHSCLSNTLTFETRSGGRHFYFEHATGLGCSAGKIAPGVDVRADGGYVIWWPTAGLPIVSNADIAPWPVWLLDLLRRDDRGDQPQRRPANFWAEMAFGVTEGRRNDALTSLIGKLFSADLEPHLALALLRGFNATRVQPPLPDDEVDRIFSSIAKTRMRRTRP